MTNGRNFISYPHLTRKDLAIKDGCLPGIALMMEAARTSETLVNFYQTTRRYNPEDSNQSKKKS
jgi:hypothetical protein